jgi:hypothetical protein
MRVEVGSTELLPETSSSTDLFIHAGLRRATTDFEVGRRVLYWGVALREDGRR